MAPPRRHRIWPGEEASSPAPPPPGLDLGSHWTGERPRPLRPSLAHLGGTLRRRREEIEVEEREVGAMFGRGVPHLGAGGEGAPPSIASGGDEG